MPDPIYWQHAQGRLVFDADHSNPRIMGILNLTPDSFSDGGRFDNPDAGLARALELLGHGADIIDIGGESTRPGAIPVTCEEECRRVLPVIERLRRERPDALISIDTTKAEVARRALHAGAAIINDVSGGLWDQEMLPVLHRSRAGFVCTHALDRPDRMQQNPVYSDVVMEISDFFKQRMEQFADAGIDSERVALDVGIGFGKTGEHNMALIRAGVRGRFDSFERPLVWGLSRKSFIAGILNRPHEPEERLAAGLAAHAALLSSGHPQIWRVHDVRATVDYLAMHRVMVATTMSPRPAAKKEVS